mgnify:CR=1 FL=1
MLYRVNISIPFIYDIHANNPEEANEKEKEFLETARQEVMDGVEGIEPVIVSVELLPKGVPNYAQD